MDNHRWRPEVVEARRTGRGSQARQSDTVGYRMLYFAHRVGEEGERPTIIRLAAPLQAVDAAMSRLMRVMTVAGALSLAVTMAIIWLISRNLSASVSRLARSAGRFAEGDLEHRVVRPHTRELEVLAASLNAMAAQLSRQISLLQSQRNEQRAILQSMSNGVIALDPEQRIISMNRAAEQTLHISAAASRGRLIQEALRQPDLNRFVADAIDSAGGLSREFELRAPLRATVQATSEPLKGPGDEPAGILIILNDVTQLRRLEQIRSDFAANVSHELRTPITTIKGYVDTMLEVGVTDSARTMKFLDVIRGNTERLAAIIEDLLALSRLEQHGVRETLAMTEVAAPAVVEAVVRDYRAAADARDITIHTDLPDDLTFLGNRQLVEQALANLVSNAIRYSPGGTPVSITARRRNGRYVEIAVADRGPGIAEEHLPRLFERFYRVDRARSRELGGTGLGLAIVKHIARVHGGAIEVESRLGEGSTFRLVLPTSARPAF
jgi:two-component system phosphate regulon sensor histidine kinase PhoR